MASRTQLLVLSAIIAAIAGGRAGDTSAATVPRLTEADFMQIDALVLAAKGHPNEEARLAGLKAYQGGHYHEALQAFERAAQYADKYSQHYLSLMYWYGVGVERDPVQACIWSDLAAERGSHKLLLIREKVWSELTGAQRAAALAQGGAYYAKYGDDVARPRAESVIRQFARDMTGSRVGYRNQALTTSGPPVNGAFAVQTGSNAAAYAIPDHANPDELYGREGGLTALSTYWAEQDRQLDAGTVEVGEPRQLGHRQDGKSPAP